MHNGGPPLVVSDSLNYISVNVITKVGNINAVALKITLY